MPRYIDADALIDDIRKHSESYFADDFAHEWVDKQPSVDVQPVRKGHWAEAKTRTYGIYECDVCKGWTYIPNEPRDYKFCPRCGAKMDGDKNG